MEDRVAGQRAYRPGAALIALAAILVITAAWWTLALWPAGAAEQEWLARTRAACFGSAHGGLPDAGGWVLLIGEPLGMLTALIMGFGDSLRRDLRRLAARRAGRAVIGGVLLMTVAVIAVVGTHVRRASAAVQPIGRGAESALTRMDQAIPRTTLVDQDGRRMSLADLQGRRFLLTFAYGHCTTVCPTIVTDLRTARRNAGRAELPLVILTLDPWRDTPERLSGMARHWGVEPGDRVLSGGVRDVELVLDELGIGRRRSETTGDIDHGTTVMLVNERGRVTWRLDAGSGGIPALFRKL